MEKPHILHTLTFTCWLLLQIVMALAHPPPSFLTQRCRWCGGRRCGFPHGTRCCERRSGSWKVKFKPSETHNNGVEESKTYGMWEKTQEKNETKAHSGGDARTERIDIFFRSTLDLFSTSSRCSIDSKRCERTPRHHHRGTPIRACACSARHNGVVDWLLGRFHPGLPTPGHVAFISFQEGWAMAC